MRNVKKIIKFYEKVFCFYTEPGTIVRRLSADRAPCADWAYFEMERLKDLYKSEVSIKNKKIIIAGLDEAGRGPMAGPVTASCVVFDGLFFLPGLDDSKKVPEKLRSYLFSAIKACASAYSVASVGPEEIDRINILNASLLAMKKALEKIKTKVDLVLIDGNHKIPGVETPQIPLVKGDSKSYSIAAASIIAKVTRDQIMTKLDETYPGYGFALHKGYCTKLHCEAIKKLGICPAHRKSFAPARV